MFNDHGASPGDYVYNDDGVAIGRINKDLTEDNRFTADGKCSQANGVIKTSGWTPPNPDRFHKEVEANPNKYLLKGFTLFHEITELPVEMWALRAAELLDGEFEDLEDLMRNLSKQPEKERNAKVYALRKLFSKKNLKPTLSPSAKRKVDDFFDNYEERLWDFFDHNEFYLFEKDTHYLSDDCTIATYNWTRSWIFLILHGAPILREHVDWYKVWRSWYGKGTRRTPELRDYFYKRLKEKLNDPSVPRRYRDLGYARRVSERYLRFIASRFIARFNKYVHQLEIVNERDELPSEYLVKRAQRYYDCSYRKAEARLIKDRHRKADNTFPTLDHDLSGTYYTDHFQSAYDSLMKDWVYSVYDNGRRVFRDKFLSDHDWDNGHYDKDRILPPEYAENSDLQE